MKPDDAEKAALRQQIAQLTLQLANFDALRAENAQLRRQLAILIDQMALQNERLGDVTSILRRREDQLRRVPKKDRSEPDPDDEPPAGGGAAGGTSSGPEDASPKAKKPRSGGGRKPVAEHVPVDPERVDLDRCGHCGSTDLLARDTETVDKYDVVREHVRCRRITRQVAAVRLATGPRRRRCRRCRGSARSSRATSWRG